MEYSKQFIFDYATAFMREQGGPPTANPKLGYFKPVCVYTDGTRACIIGGFLSESDRFRLDREPDPELESLYNDLERCEVLERREDIFNDELIDLLLSLQEAHDAACGGIQALIDNGRIQDREYADAYFMAALQERLDDVAEKFKLTPREI